MCKGPQAWWNWSWTLPTAAARPILARWTSAPALSRLPSDGLRRRAHIVCLQAVRGCVSYPPSLLSLFLLLPLSPVLLSLLSPLSLLTPLSLLPLLSLLYPRTHVDSGGNVPAFAMITCS